MIDTWLVVRQAMIRLRAYIRHEYAGSAKILTWHASHMRTEVARLRHDFPQACEGVAEELTALETDALARAEQLEVGSVHSLLVGAAAP